MRATLDGIAIPEGQVALAARIELSRRETPATFREFVIRLDPRYRWYRWNEHLAEVLSAWEQGEFRQLMVHAPPSMGKSELCSRKLPAYILRRDPTRRVGLTSYSLSLARTLAWAARDNFTASGGRLHPTAQVVDHWYTSDRGDMWVAGIGGSITGKHCDFAIGDDLVKGYAEAMSPTLRRRDNEWINTVWERRFLKGFQHLQVGTRWAEDDPHGFFLSKLEGNLKALGWHVLNLQLIKERVTVAYPEAVTVIDDGRDEGDLLCPEQIDRDEAERIRGDLLPHEYEALYQGTPSDTAGHGRVLHRFDKAINVPAAPVKDPGGDLLIGMDFNVNPMSAVIGGRAVDELHLFDTIALRDSGTMEMCQEIARRFWRVDLQGEVASLEELRPTIKRLAAGRPLRPITVCPDPSGKSRNSAAGAGRTDFAIIRAFGFRLSAPESAPPVSDRINETNRMLQDGAGRPRILMDAQGCKPLIESCARLTYKDDSGLINKTKGYDHFVDALGYLVGSEFPIVRHRATRRHVDIG